MKGQQCTPCPDPNDSYLVERLEEEIDVPGVGVVTCGFVQTALPSVLSAGSDQCITVQSIGTFCGCPVSSNACKGLCDAYDAQAVVSNFLGFQGYNARCDLVQSHLESFVEGSDDCSQKVARYSSLCGCQGDIFEDGAEDLPEDTAQQQNGLFSPFSLCPDGSDPLYPEKDMMEFISRRQNSTNPLVQLASQFSIDGKLTCEWMDQIGKGGLVPTDNFIRFSEEHLLVAGECGCPATENQCNFCPTNDITLPNEPFPLTKVVFDVEITCAEVSQMLTQYEKTDFRCWSSKNFAFLCGCNGGTAWYLGADSETEHKTLAWIPRVTGFLSFLGSVFIIQDILRKRKYEMTVSTYHMILLGMSLFDISSSIAWMVSTAALPSYDEERESESGVYGAKGNEATCKAQGFFLELGFVGSTAFTASLTTFYVLTIIFGYKETRMRSFRKYLMIIPTVLAVALASAAIPYYRPFYVACLVSNPNSEVDRYADDWRQLIFFSILPVGTATLISVINMSWILRFVVVQNRKTERWRFQSFMASQSTHGTQQPISSPIRTDSAVFWQAFWYVVAFLLTWVIYMIGQFKPYFSGDDDKLYSFWVALLTLNPLMGFWNAFVYAKPWTWRWRQWTIKLNQKDTKQVAEPLYKLPVNPATSKMSRESSFKPNAIPDESMANAELGGDSINKRRLPSASTFGIAVSAEASDDEKSFFSEDGDADADHQWESDDKELDTGSRESFEQEIP